MKRIIRKLTVGNPYGSNPRIFQVGSVIGLSRGDKIHEISRIRFLDKHFLDCNERMYEIWLKNTIENTEVCWKTVSAGNQEFHIEYDLNF